MRRNRLGWAAWLLAAAALYFFENNAGTRALLAASVLLPTLSLVCAALSARRTGCALAMPAAIEKGETALLRCRVVGSRLLPGCAVFCDLAIENPLTGEARTEALRAAGSEFTLPLTAATCGQLRATVTRAAVGDWFGLGRFPVAMLDRASALVTPPRAEEPDAPAFDAGQGESAGGGPRGAEPDADIRDYVPGDPVRLIHWKLSAKLDRTLIREARTSVGSGLFLMLETARADCSPRAMDAAAAGFLTLSGELAEAGIAHSACWYDHDSEELRWLEVKNLADWEKMRAEALRAASAPSGAGVAWRFADAYPYVRPGRTLLFSPRGDADVSPLPVDSVTLLLPADAPDAGATGAAEVVRLRVDAAREGESA